MECSLRKDLGLQGQVCQFEEDTSEVKPVLVSKAKMKAARLPFTSCSSKASSEGGKKESKPVPVSKVKRKAEEENSQQDSVRMMRRGRGKQKDSAL